ncbi:MAG: hypothetical protein ACJ8DJ_04535, partial [Gemmatimonadales bacterium]
GGQGTRTSECSKRSAKGGVRDESLESPAMTLPALDEDAPLLLCPACGFDLRATASERCGECGLEIDRAALAVSGIPWTHRRRIGRVRGYLATAWQIAIDRKALRHEAAKPQEIADGRAFRRVTGALLAAAFVGAFLVAVHFAGGLKTIAVQVGEPISPTMARTDSRLFDVAVPWCAGATIPGVLPACLALAAFGLAGAQRFVFRVPGAPDAHRVRAAALSYYTTAPLLLLVPAIGCWIADGVLQKQDWFRDVGPMRVITATLLLAGPVLVLFGFLGTVYRVAQWLARVRHCGLGGAAPGVAELAGLWLLGGVVVLAVVPWCVGFSWIVIDSLR